MAAVARRQKSDNPDLQPYYAQASPTLLAQQPSDPQFKKPSSQEAKEWATLYEHCEAQFQSLYTWRTSVWTTWGQIARYMLPRRFYAFQTGNMFNQGQRQDYAIVDRTATLAGEVCSAGLMSGLTDPDRPWVTLGPALPGLELDKQGQMWYDDLTERYRYVLDHCNFYDAQAQHYEDLTFFGTAPIIDYPDANNILQCFTPCAGEYLLGTGMNNTDETFYREFRQTVNQSVDMFGAENCGPDIQRMWREKGAALQYENIIGHCIEPNYAIGGRGDTEVPPVDGGFTWREVYWLRGKKDMKPLSVTGFHEQPYAVSRWNTQGNEAYGRGVGENMLADCIQLQLETRQKAESIEKVNRPPMGADVSLMNMPASTNPGKITYFNTGANGEKKFFPLYEVKPDIPALTQDIQLIQQRLERTAYNDIFRMMESLRDKTKGQVTATEIDALKEESLMRLGPVINRVYGSLRLRVKRHLSIMARAGLIPKKPPSLQGVPTKIDFVSMLTAAQNATSTAAIARSVQFAGTVSAVYPESRFVIDPEEAIREFNKGIGAPSRILRAPNEVKKLAQAEAQQTKAAQALQATTQGAQAAGVLSKTSLAPGNALSALVGPRA